MRITGLDTQPLVLPLRRSVTTSRGSMEARRGWHLRVHAGGVTGTGEVTPLPSTGTEDVERAARALDALKLDGVACRSVADVEALVNGVLGDDTPATRFGLETALLDALGQELRVGVASLLSGGARDGNELNALIDAAGDPSTEIGTWRDRGFRAFKVKVGTGDDVARVRAARSAAGPDAVLRLDANGAWSVEQAAVVLDAVASTSPDYCEDPVSTWNDARVLRSRVPLAADAWLADARGRRELLRSGVAGVLILKPAVVGGVLAARRLVLESGLRAVVSCSLDGVVARLAALHLACSLPVEEPAGLATGHLLVEELPDPVVIHRGRAALPRGPGLGLPA